MKFIDFATCTLFAWAAVGCAATSATPQGMTTSAKMPVPMDDSPVTGPADAWVTLVEFADFECSYCGKAAPTVAKVLANYPVDVRLSWRYFPLTQVHPHALQAAIAAECAREQGKFWAMHDQLFAHQDQLDASDLPNYATAVGLDLPTWQACLTAPAAAARVASDLALGQKLGVTGTPTFVFNGEPLAGALPYSMFVDAIATARSAAVASGIPAADYYAKAILGQ